MDITLQNVGKRFENSWVFRNISKEFKEAEKYAIVGPNGSGKSTLLKLISGSLTVTEGAVTYQYKGAPVEYDKVYANLSIAAPYLDIPEEYTLKEIVTFHKTFKSIGLSVQEVIAKLELGHTGDKLYKRFSSGMKQRVKLGLAILSNTPLLLLDEPCATLDASAVKWYHSLIADYSSHKTVLVFSNHKEEEYKFCQSVVHLKS